MWKCTKLLAQRKGLTQFLTFIQRTLRFLLNCVSHGEPDCAYWWGTGHSQRGACYVAKLLLEPLWYKCKERKNIHIHSYFHIPIYPECLHPAHIPACVHTGNVDWVEKQTFGPLPLCWIFMSTCFLPKPMRSPTQRCHRHVYVLLLDFVLYLCVSLLGVSLVEVGKTIWTWKDGTSALYKWQCNKCGVFSFIICIFIHLMDDLIWSYFNLQWKW